MTAPDFGNLGVVKIFLASPGDLAEERARTREVVDEVTRSRAGSSHRSARLGGHTPRHWTPSGTNQRGRRYVPHLSRSAVEALGYSDGGQVHVGIRRGIRPCQDTTNNHGQTRYMACLSNS